MNTEERKKEKKEEDKTGFTLRGEMKEKKYRAKTKTQQVVSPLNNTIISE